MGQSYILLSQTNSRTLSYAYAAVRQPLKICRVCTQNAPGPDSLQTRHVKWPKQGKTLPRLQLERTEWRFRANAAGGNGGGCTPRQRKGIPRREHRPSLKATEGGCPSFTVMRFTRCARYDRDAARYDRDHIFSLDTPFTQKWPFLCKCRFLGHADYTKTGIFV